MTRKLLVIALITLTLCVFTVAQTTRGSIAGIVTDASGAAINGATVTASAKEGGDTRTVTTGSNGQYRLDSLTPGLYLLTVTAPGFGEVRTDNVRVSTSQVTSTNVPLDVKKASETVTVEATTNEIQTESGQISGVINTSEVRNLPIASGNPFALASTLPGVSTVQSRDDFTNGASFSVNGLRPRSNNFLIDGFDNNDNGIAGQAFQPANQEAVQEVTVLTNSYQAEYGRGGASVSNLSFRSGGNVLHGGAWWNYAGAGLDAVAAEYARSGYTRPPQYVNNLWGFRLGGPIKKDKLYYFGTAQWSRNVGASPFASELTVPTAAGIATLQSLGPNPQVDILLQSLGNVRGTPGTVADPILLGARPGCPAPCAVEVGSVIRTDKVKSRNREITGRLDFLPSPTDTIYVRYTDSYQNSSPDLFANPTALPSNDTQQSGPSRIFGAMWSHVFNPKIINELRFSVQQIDFIFEPTPAALSSPLANLPSFDVGGDFDFLTFGGFSQEGTFPQGRGHKTFQFQDAVSWTAGSHNFKLGADITTLLIKDTIPFNSAGYVSYSESLKGCGGGGCSALANFIDNFSGTSGTITKQFGNPLATTATNQQAYYFQDTWKLRPNFTVDYGIRYEYQPPDMFNQLRYPAINRNTVLTDPLDRRIEVQPDRNNFGPRVGFAYTPHFWRGLFGEDKTVIRAGYGIFYDVFFTNISNNTAASTPNALGFTQNGGNDPSGRGQANASGLLATASPIADPTDLRFTELSDLHNPMIHQWNLNIQRELPSRMLLEVAYVGTRAQGLWVNQQLNPRTGWLPDFSDYQDRLNPNFGSIVPRTNGGDSIYHGLQTTVSRNYGRLALRGSYTWSRSIDNMSEVFATSGGSSRWQDVFNPRGDRGPSAFHRTHRAAFTWVYELPGPKSGFMNAVLGGWTTGGTVSFQSGAPDTIYVGGFDVNGDGEAFNDRPSAGNPNGTHQLVYGGTGDGLFRDWNTDAVVAPNDARYIMVLGQNGNIGRNSFYWPGRQDWNLTASKRFKMPYREGHQIEFRADLFNAFNHPNAGAGNLDADVTSSTFRNIENTRYGGRSIQTWLKYTF